MSSPWYFFWFRVCIHITTFQTFAFSKNSKNNIKTKKNIIFLKKIGINRKKYHGDDIENVFLNKMRPFPSKSVQNYGLGLRQQIKYGKWTTPDQRGAGVLSDALRRKWRAASDGQESTCIVAPTTVYHTHVHRPTHTLACACARTYICACARAPLCITENVLITRKVETSAVIVIL